MVGLNYSGGSVHGLGMKREHGLCIAGHDAEDLANGVPPATGSTYSTVSSPAGNSQPQKRRRDAFRELYPSAARPKPRLSMAEVLALADVSDAQVAACNVRCGVGALLPIKAAVRCLFRDTVRRLCGIIPLDLWTVAFEQALETVDQILFGFTESRGIVPSPPSPASFLFVPITQLQLE